MGASLVYLNEPNKEVESEKGSNAYLSYAAGSMQGWRLNMVRTTNNRNINLLPIDIDQNCWQCIKS